MCNIVLLHVDYTAKRIKFWSEWLPLYGRRFVSTVFTIEVMIDDVHLGNYLEV